MVDFRTSDSSPNFFPRIDYMSNTTGVLLETGTVYHSLPVFLFLIFSCFFCVLCLFLSLFVCLFFVLFCFGFFLSLFYFGSYLTIRTYCRISPLMISSLTRNLLIYNQTGNSASLRGVPSNE